MIRELFRDAVELAKAACGESTSRNVVTVVLQTDSYAITSINRTRDAARALHIPFVNHALRLVQTAIFAIEIDSGVVLGDGVYFVHPIGIVVGGTSRIGARVRFYGNNTIGTVRDDGYPVIEDDVVIGAGARILGPIRIGARSIIGANAVVLNDVPPDHVAVGMPARVHPRRSGDLVEPRQAGSAH